jgi:hypothetical protein
MLKRFLLIMALLLLLGQVSSISAQDTINFATKQNNLVYPGEIPEVFPNVRLNHKGRHYWVVTFLSSDSLTGFAPVLDSSSPELPDSKIARRELIKTAYVLRYEQKLDTSSRQQQTWLFDAASAKFFNDLSMDLKNERVDLTTVKASLGDYPGLQSQVDSLNEQLEDIYPLAGEISDSLQASNAFNASYVAGPDTNRLREFQDSFQAVFDLVAGLDALRAVYLQDLDALRQAIAVTDLPFETKQGLNSLANIPNSFQQFSSKSDNAIYLEEKLAEVFDNAFAKVDGLVSDLETREVRNTAFQALFGRDDEILEETGEGSLGNLFGVLLDEQYIFLWNEQEDLAKAQEDWEKAKAFYEAGSFDQAEDYAIRAKKPALKVFEGGLSQEEPVFDPTFLFGGAILLIVLLIVLYLLRNRDKIADLVSSREEEVQLHEWEK